MNCEECRCRLPLHSMGLLDDFERVSVNRHLASCQQCLRESELLGAVVDSVRQAAAPAEPGAEECLDELRREVWSAAEKRGHARRAPSLSRLKVAAVFLVMTGALAGGALLLGSRALPHSTVSSESDLSHGTGRLRELWALAGSSSPSSIAQRPVVIGSTLFAVAAPDSGRQVVAYDTRTGRTRWVGPRGCIGYLAPAPERLLAVCDVAARHDPAIVALDPASGTELWRFSPDSSERRWGMVAPSVLGNRVLWVSGRSLYCLDTDSGARLWQHRFADRGLATPAAFAGGAVCVGTAEALVMIDPQTGTPMARIPYGSPMSEFASPLIATSGSRIIVAHRKPDSRGVVLCFDSQARKTAWEQETPALYHMEASGGMVLLRGQSVYALDAGSGRMAWRADAGGCSPVTGVDGCCFVASTAGGGSLLQLDLFSGRVLGRYPIDVACTGLVLDQTNGYLQGASGVLRAVDMRSAKPCKPSRAS